ncbi:MAG: protoporphyrinogen oxidase HemJ [Hyphomicrobium sp.]|nr:protoporphyrinogen oxidase HemJ [Hyphomicrobium sp.]
MPGSTQDLSPDLAGQSAAKRSIIAVALTIVVALGLMLILGEAAYLWLKSLHVVAIIAWMAGLLYLPRLFVYHADAPAGSAQSELFKVMERRLLFFIMTPAMAIAWVLGLWLAWQGGFFWSGWFLAKLVLVLALSGAHEYLAASVRRFAADRNDKPSRHWRIVNEVPTVLMILIVILVIVKPF